MKTLYQFQWIEGSAFRFVNIAADSLEQAARCFRRHHGPIEPEQVRKMADSAKTIVAHEDD